MKTIFKHISLLVLILVGLFSHAQNETRALSGGGNSGPRPNLSSGDYVILNTSLDLNPGGVVYDVAYDSILKIYVIVGDFTTIGSNSYNNIAILDSNLSVPLSSLGEIQTSGFDAPIKTVEVIDGQSILIGGEFTDITILSSSNLRGYMAEYTYSGGYSYFLSTWNPDFDYFVHDILVKGDTVLVAGEFYQTGVTVRELIAAFSYPSKLLMTSYPAMATSALYSRFGINDLVVVNDSIFASVNGPDNLIRLDGNGEVDPSFTPVRFCDWSPCNARSDKCLRYNDSCILYGANSSAYSGYIMEYYNWGGAISLGSPNDREAFEAYKEEIHYTYSEDGVRAYRGNTQQFLATSAFYNTNATKTLVRLNNKLFVSSPNLIDIGGENRTGLAVFCLEPENAKTLIEGDSLACAGYDSLVYRIAPVENAEGYIWNYTGGGCTEFGSGIALSIHDSIVTDVPQLTVGFNNDFSPGQIQITPISDCGLTSNTFIVNVGSYPLPNAFAGIDTTLNCVRDSVTLIGTSSTPNVTTQWWKPASLFPVTGTNMTIGVDSSFVFEVVDSIGCSNFDTVTVTMDTIHPVANDVPLPYDLTCAITSRTFTGASTNPSDSIAWRFNSGLYTNPITASTIGTYTLIVTDRINGCADSSKAAVVGLDNNPPDLGILNYPAYSPIAYLETITCTNDSIELITTSITPNTITNWTNADSSSLFGDSLTITTSGTYYITAIDTSNGCSTYKQVLIDADTIQPDVILPLASDLTCSLDSVELDGSSTVTFTTLEWSGNGLTPAIDPVFVNTQGMYYLTVTNDTNGCSNIDSVSVGYTPEIILSIDSDTTICDKENVTLNVQYIGTNITGISYLWNNGSISNTSNYIGGDDSLAIVEIFGNNSCYGRDTAFITIPPAPVSDIQTFQPCASDNDGQLVANMIDGWAPYTYAIHPDSTYQASPVFQNLTASTYEVQVLDSLGCHYTFNATIDANSNLPQPLFLMSTNNFVSDTVVLVDVSTPPTDSTFWTFPSAIEVLDSNATAPVIILPDTGSFEITMTAYFGSCEIIMSKWVYSAEFDTTFANHTNQNGIKTIALYPNPNDGNFNLEIEFYKKQQVSVTIQDINGNLFLNQQYAETDLIEEFIQLSNTISGTYILKVVSEYDSGSIPFIINE